MADFGGLGGVPGGRPFNEHDRFEVDVNRALGERMRLNKDVGQQMWSALANVEWRSTDGKDTASYTFRAACDMIAAIRDKSENYLDFYCNSPYPLVSELIREAMAGVGWEPV